MLKFYLTTVVIWMIIISSIIAIFKDMIIKKIGTAETKKTNSIRVLKTLFIFAAVPIFRLLVAVTLIYIAVCKQEDFDEIMKKYNNN